MVLLRSAALVLLALATLPPGDDMSDAAPRWAFLLVLAALPGVAGRVVLLVARWRASRAGATPGPAGASGL